MFEIWLRRMAQREAPSAMRQTALPARHQYGLQIAERRGKIRGELSIAGPIFDYHRTNDGHRDGDEPAAPGSPFANLKDEDKVCIEETEEWRLPVGEMLVKEGKHAEHFFVLLEGEMSVWKKHAEQRSA
jgi:CRP-like cAMP-binding protein